MTPYLQDPDFTLWHGDSLETLQQLPDRSVDCIATSPPFFGLRDYGTEGQIGLEASPDEWADRLVQVLREARRVLADHGTCWIECGDSYNSQGTMGPTSGRSLPQPGMGFVKREVNSLKHKDLIGAPWLLAFALRADGWYLRQCLIWAKPNCMPESAKDRCTTSHSYIFLLSKKPRYWFDADAISEPAEWARWGDQTVPKHEGTDTAAGWIPAKAKYLLTKGPGGNRADAPADGFIKGGGWAGGPQSPDGRKNARSVWTVPTQGYPGAHFATWPEALTERILLAGCPEWVCSTCGKARERLRERTDVENHRVRDDVGEIASIPSGIRSLSGSTYQRVDQVTGGWSDCGHNNYRPGIVLDPFGGSGTTALVARRHNRRSVLIELNESYCDMAAERLQQLSLLALSPTEGTGS